MTEKQREYYRQWRAKNREKDRERKREWAVNNIEKCRESHSKSRAKCREKINEGRRKWRINNRERANASAALWRIKNSGKVLHSRRKWEAENKGRARELRLRWRIKNREKINANYREKRIANRDQFLMKVNQYRRRRFSTNIQYKMSCVLRSRITDALKRKDAVKVKSTEELIGISLIKFLNHIELQFRDGMTWENHGYDSWHIDHIIPCASFDLTDPEQQKLCFHYTNLQPLWWYENLSKGVKHV